MIVILDRMIILFPMKTKKTLEKQLKETNAVDEIKKIILEYKETP